MSQPAVQPTKVLLFSIKDANHPVTADILKKVCEQENVKVQRVAIFQKKGLQAFVEFATVAESIRIKTELHDCEIFPGSCSLEIEHSPAETINVRVNSDMSYNIDIGKPNRSFWPTIESHTNVELAKEQKLQALLASAQGIPGAQNIIEKAMAAPQTKPNQSMGGGAINGRSHPPSPSIPANTKGNNNVLQQHIGTNYSNNNNSPVSNKSFPHLPSPTLPPTPLMGVQTQFEAQKQPNFNVQNRPNFNVQNQPNLNLQNQPNLNLQNQPNVNLQNQPNVNLQNRNQINQNTQNEANLSWRDQINQMNQPNLSQNQPNLVMQNQPKNTGQNYSNMQNQPNNTGQNYSNMQNQPNNTGQNYSNMQNQPNNTGQNYSNITRQNVPINVGQNQPIGQNPLYQNQAIVTQKQNRADNVEEKLDCTGGEGCVTMLFNINSEKVNCDHLFNLFCCYGNVVMIKILLKKNKPSCAMVQFTDQLSTELAIEHLNKLYLFGLQVQVSTSKLQCIKDNSHCKLFDGSPSVVSYAQSPNNKFKCHEGDDDLLSRIHAPSKVLQYSNAPPGFTDGNLVLLFKSLNAKMPMKHKLMSRANSKSCSGLIQFSMIACAVEALMMCSHIALHKDNDAGGAPLTFKLNFSSLSIKD